jgi:hypothetical protein
MITPAQLTALLHIGKFAIETVELGMAGTLTQEQADARLELMRSQLDHANTRWEAAGNEEIETPI